MKRLSEYKLIIFDLDGTLADRDSGELLPRVKDFFAGANMLGDEFQYAIATNQGGVGMRYWMESEGFGNPEKYPTEADIVARINQVVSAINEPFVSKPLKDSLAFGFAASFMVYICYRYESSKGKWSPFPKEAIREGNVVDPKWIRFNRKPDPGMLLAAMDDVKVLPVNTLMVGDRPEDEEAAKNANCDFMWADEFFGRGVSE